jgi:hypothetical protein
MKRAKKILLGVVAVLGLLFLANEFLSAKEQPIKIEVTDSGEKAHVEHTVLHREKIRQRAVLNTIISGQHVRLICDKTCEDLAPGEYLGELHGTSVKLFYTVPLTHKSKRDSYTVVGSW